MNPAPNPVERRLYHFDEFVVDPVRRVLLRDGEPVAVTPKALSLLLALLERNGEVMTKPEIIEKVWPDTRVTEANLTQNVSFLRKALGERADAKRYIVTIPGQGYSFVGEVRQVASEPVPPSGEVALLDSTVLRRDQSGVWRIASFLPEAVPPADPPVAEPVPATAEIPTEPVPERLPARAGLPRDGMLALAAALVLLLGLAGALWFAGRRAPAAPASPTAAAPGRADSRAGAAARPSVAVLGFKNLSAGKEGEWLAPALSEILATELAAGPAVRVISGEKVAQARQALGLPYSESGEGYDLGRLRSILSADLVTVGSYVYMESPRGRQIRLDLRVLKLPEGAVVTSLVEIGTEAELFDLVSRTGADLRRALGFSDLSPDETREAEALRPASPDAAGLYAQGLARLRAFDPLGGRDLLTQAVQLDPKSALIHSALSQAWADLGYDARAVGEARKAFGLAESLSREQRLELEGRFYSAGRQWGQAAEVYRSLWTFFPDDLEYALRLTTALMTAGKSKEALDVVAELRKLPAPVSDDPGIDIAEAMAAFRQSDMAALERAATSAIAKGRASGESLVVGRALILRGTGPLFTGRPRDAIRFFEEAGDIYSRAGYRWGTAMAAAHIGIAHYRNGDYPEAEKADRKALAIAQSLGNANGISSSYTNLGLLYQSWGDLRQALDYHERARSKIAADGDEFFVARTLYSIGIIHLAQGDLDGARRDCEEALTASRRTGNRSDEARALATLGTILGLRGSLAEARGYHDKALGILKGINDPSFTTPVLVDAVDVLARLGDTTVAAARAEEGLAAARRAGDRIGTAKLLGALGGIALRQGDLPALKTRSTEQLRVAREIGARDLIAAALQNLGRAALAGGDIAGARKLFGDSLRASEESGESMRATATRLDLARLELVDSRPAEATRLAGETAEWYAARGVSVGEARARAVLAEGLLRQGLLAGARVAADRSRALTEGTDDLGLRLETAIRLARVAAAAGQAPRALQDLRQAAELAARSNFIAAELEARLASGEISLSQNDREKGLAAIQAVRRDAEARGLGLLAKRAAELLAGGGARRPS
jgi:DNA-binding winged helix-turn-helix (wHTH) protein/tetratricopeptide (TPR) repeat protein/TolB-like protein